MNETDFNSVFEDADLPEKPPRFILVLIILTLVN